MTGNARWWIRAAQAGLVIVIAWGVVRALSGGGDFAWRDITALRPSPVRLVVSLLLLVSVFVAHALLWRRVMTDLAVARPPAGTALRVYFLASLGRYIPGKIWQLAGLAVLAQRAGMPATGAAGAALLGQFAFLATGLLFLAVLLPEWSRGLAGRAAGALLVIVAGVFWLIIATPHGQRVREWARRRFGEKLSSAIDLVERVRGRETVRWGVWYGATWIVTGLAFSIFVSAFVPEAASHTRQVAGAIAASYLAGYLVLFAPAGIGVREGAMTGLLAAVPAIPVSAAVAIAIASRIWFTVAELIPLATLPFLRGRAAPDSGASAGTGSPPGSGRGA
ncbi:MAG: lysylphosphatidylglycerol synthase domain-containing protein [Gemmatimonadetes bacterium]|nr:lysylphosphatidylglycerol synthase domain-containing protein [Gemmatimonadota bacterium]